jgi:hypothetical protein
MNYNEDEVRSIMLILLNTKNNNICDNTITRLLRSHYGVLPVVVLHIWNVIKNNLPINARVKHLLWMFAYCKSYGEYEHYSTMFKVSIPSFSSWVWQIAKLVGQMEIVSKFFICIYLTIIN